MQPPSPNAADQAILHAGRWPPGQRSHDAGDAGGCGASASPDNPRGTRAGSCSSTRPHYSFAPAYLLSERDLIIGRDPAAGRLHPRSGGIPRQHARIHYEGKQLGRLRSQAGRNGTLVDGQFIREVALEDLHEIRVGDAIFKFVEAGAESYARYRIDGPSR